MCLPEFSVAASLFNVLQLSNFASTRNVSTCICKADVLSCSHRTLRIDRDFAFFCFYKQWLDEILGNVFSSLPKTCMECVQKLMTYCSYVLLYFHPNKYLETKSDCSDIIIK